MRTEDKFVFSYDTSFYNTPQLDNNKHRTQTNPSHNKSIQVYIVHMSHHLILPKNQQTYILTSYEDIPRTQISKKWKNFSDGKR